MERFRGGEVPDLVKQFVVYFYRHIRERNIYEIYSMFDSSFHKLSERYFKTTPWPAAEAIAEYVDNDHVFCLLYKEMYFRHLYAKLTPSLDQRIQSWETYCSLFGIILNRNVNMQLPNGWLWQMIDEFIYQFQSFCQYRAKLYQRTPEEIEGLKQCGEVWSPLAVLNYLQTFVDKSDIVAELKRDGGKALAETEGYVDARNGRGSNCLKVLGYFARVGLLRVHCILGDYCGGLQAMEPLDLHNKTGLYTKVTLCHISASYYTGFCYLMMRRYLDAIKVFNQGLVFIARIKQYHSRSSGYDQILQKMEQMYALLALAVALCPAGTKSLEENVQTNLREKHAEKLSKMTRSELPVFDELFTYACPKFITPSLPDYSNPSANISSEAYKLQLKMFLTEIQQQNQLPVLKQYLKLYTSISVSKLADLMGSGTEQLLTLLMCLKHKTSSSGATDFMVDVDGETGEETVQIGDVKIQRNYLDYYSNHISKLKSICSELNAPARQQQSAKSGGW
ncbi:subunit L of translation initiation factor 3 [Chloropicon primus]|uniref:Eukaryotic translation initiation factor 3 subunit L n=1 Tax=Chloropicon primus TaxID=1764295 RepID=A0A5B8MZI7_9CHLO|nr:subunit L of translation initiation factor 3 [Chloropicon primus]UPR04033.1 subunit L of translation initiation factor 3 [Chloropicon primus]|eukprot:QDZ24824.1 subunit L of translation initiation factor 3 [Chloropicon primus]